jgi:predicted phosphodiesterase
MKIGIIADIHSNAPALRAVLDDLAQRQIETIINLGDAFNGPIDPAGVADLLGERPMIHIRGNGERMVLAENPAERAASAEFARARLQPAHLEWIRSWPFVYHEELLFACHGSPASDVEYLLEDISEGKPCLRPLVQIEASLSKHFAPLILCAHSHVPRLVRTSRSWVVNPGSVGLPAYTMKTPVPHRMETGSSCARYAIAGRSGSAWTINHVAVAYDHEQAARAAEREGFRDWITALRTGYAT